MQKTKARSQKQYNTAKYILICLLTTCHNNPGLKTVQANIDIDHYRYFS